MPDLSYEVLINSSTSGEVSAYLRLVIAPMIQFYASKVEEGFSMHQKAHLSHLSHKLTENLSDAETVLVERHPSVDLLQIFITTKTLKSI